MNLLTILIWIVIVTSFTLFGSWYARKYNKADMLIGLYVAFVLISNIIAYKIAAFDLGYVFYADAATIVFAVTFLFTDIVNEKFGRAETQKMILIAFVSQLAVMCFVWLSIILPPAPFWGDQAIYAQIMGYTPRIMIASLIAFFIAENFDAYIFAWFKKITKDKHLWMRNAFSSLPSMVIDTTLFVTLAFYGTQPLWPLIVGVVVIKWVVGIIDIPFMYLNRWVMSK